MDDINQEQLADLKALVRARLNLMSPETVIYLGIFGQFKRDDILAHVEAGDEIGTKFITIDWQFLQSLKTGEIYEAIAKYS